MAGGVFSTKHASHKPVNDRVRGGVRAGSRGNVVFFGANIVV